jgi:hypothetical protein
VWGSLWKSDVLEWFVGLGDDVHRYPNSLTIVGAVRYPSAIAVTFSLPILARVSSQNRVWFCGCSEYLANLHVVREFIYTA